MRESLTELFECPMCGSSVAIKLIASWFVSQGRRHVVDGILVCTDGHEFPVLDEVPRLVPASMRSDEESAALEGLPRRRPECVEPVVVSEQEVDEIIRARIATEYGIGPTSTLASQQRAKRGADYHVAEYRGENKRKYARLLARLGLAPRTVLDVGGLMPGLIRCLDDAFGLQHGVVADLGTQYAAAFKTKDRRVCLVRADAQRLPFKRRAFDLTVSAFLLEHVPNWRAALASIVKSADTAFVAYGPNRWFPFEISHLNAPLAGTLPPRVGKYVVHAWYRMRGRPRSLKWIADFLAEMSYISSAEFRRECVRLSISPRNIFPEMMDEILEDRDAPRTRLRRMAQSWPTFTRLSARALTVSGMEPQVYHLLRASSERTVAQAPRSDRRMDESARGIQARRSA